MKTILVTGGAGYVGSGLLRALLKNGFRVICVDKLLFGGESILGLWHEPNFEFYNLDIVDSVGLREIIRSTGVKYVIHLAAIVGDPACKLNPDLAVGTNWEASKKLVEISVEQGIEKFAFASTCSNYGKMSTPDSFVDETSELAPVSLYAELKVKFEKYLLDLKEDATKFAPVCLRFSTVYGLSPRMRFDLTVNEFSKELALGRELVVFGEKFWRPYCHVKDFSNAFLTVLDCPVDKIAYKVFNVGDTSENYTKQMIVYQLKQTIPDAKIKYVAQLDDPRDYRVNCDLIKNELGFSITMTVPQGIKEIVEVVRKGVIRNPDDQIYYNIPHRVNN